MSTYSYLLRDRSKNYEGWYKDHYDWEDEHDMFFQWFDNNYSCDCNRSLFLYDLDFDDCYECSGSENVIEVLEIVNNETGEKVYFNDYLD